jgi:hypothetical protein
MGVVPGRHDHRAARPAQAQFITGPGPAGPGRGRPFAVQRELQIELQRLGVEMARRVVAHHRAFGLGQIRGPADAAVLQRGQHQGPPRRRRQHQLDVVVEAGRDEAAQGLAADGDADHAGAGSPHAQHAQAAHRVGMAHPFGQQMGRHTGRQGLGIAHG